MSPSSFLFLLAGFPVFSERGTSGGRLDGKLKTTERNQNVRFFAFLLQVVQDGPYATTGACKWRAYFRYERVAVSDECRS